MFEVDAEVDRINIKDWVTVPPSTLPNQSYHKTKVRQTVHRFVSVNYSKMNTETRLSIFFQKIKCHLAFFAIANIEFYNFHWNNLSKCGLFKTWTILDERLQKQMDQKNYLKNDTTGCPKKHGNSVTNSISSS